MKHCIGFLSRRTTRLTRSCAVPRMRSKQQPILSVSDIAKEAVKIAEDSDTVGKLLNVRAPRIIQDNRMPYSTPTGEKDALIFSCEGTGV